VAVVMENALLHRQMSERALTDGLTGLLNHRTFMEKLTEELNRLDRGPQPFSLLLLDIDHFKRVNDTYGHPVGDEALRTVAGIVKRSVRAIDYVARYGGEEFAVGLVGADGRGAEQMAERIRKTVEKTPVTAGRTTFSCTLSIGASTLRTGERKEGLIARADAALYHAKRTGRNRICLHEQLTEAERAAAGKAAETASAAPH
jgi:diguanylate cyclase (GGDEF)-like protein